MNAVRQRLKEAFGHAQAGRLNDAAMICRELLDAEPGLVEPHYLLGLDAAQRGDRSAAVSHLERFLARHDGDAGAWFNLGVVQQQRGEASAALRAYRRVLELAPATPQAWMNLAALLETGRSAGAADDLRASGADALDQLQTRLVAPIGAETLLGLARARLATGTGAAAIPLLEAALAQTENPALYDAQAVLLAAAGRADEAIEHARAAVAGDPDQANYWFNLAASLSRRTDTADLTAAAEAARRALALAPQHAAASHCLGLVAAKLGQEDEAASALERAHELAPGALRCAIDLGDFRVRRGELDRGIGVLAAAAGGSDPTGEASRQLGVALLRANRPGEALAALARAEQSAATDQRVIAHRATALQHVGRHADAEVYLGFDRHIRTFRFHAPEGFADLAAFNGALADDIRNHSRLRWEPVGLAARNGSLTEELMADRTPAILGFESQLRDAIEAVRTGAAADGDDPFLRRVPGPDYELNIWATCMQGGGHIDTHIHEESWLSGAFYVHLPGTLGASEDSPEGWIEFGRPHAEIPFPEGARLELVRPEPGLLVVFPSYLFHRTLPHAGDEDRISISFDLVPR